VKPAPFTYHSPATVPETLSLLAELGTSGKVLAGGQSLIPILNMRLSSPAHLVDINQVGGLDTVSAHGDLRVGALARHARVERDGQVRRGCPLLAQALRLVAHPAIRNRGTVCGALAHADPASELPGVLLLTGGSVEVARAGAPVRDVAAADFFAGPLEPTLEAGDLVVAARFPLLAPRTGTEFTEIARRRGDYALCGVGAMVTVDGGGEVTAARAVYIGSNPVPLVLDLTDAIGGRRPDSAGYAAAGRLARAAVDPGPDIHATAEYRRELSAVLTERALATAAARAADAARRERGARAGGAGANGRGLAAGPAEEEE
jgi:aerobic carbon-monoxide dehydrogenase medium subunit